MPNRSAGPIKAVGGSECNPSARAAEIAEEKSNLKLKWREFVSPLLSCDDSSRVGNETRPGFRVPNAARCTITSRFESSIRFLAYANISLALSRGAAFRSSPLRDIVQN